MKFHIKRSEHVGDGQRRNAGLGEEEGKTSSQQRAHTAEYEQSSSPFDARTISNRRKHLVEALPRARETDRARGCDRRL
jgi:hypothetical protein